MERKVRKPDRVTVERNGDSHKSHMGKEPDSLGEDLHNSSPEAQTWLYSPPSQHVTRDYLVA